MAKVSCVTLIGVLLFIHLPSWANDSGGNTEEVDGAQKSLKEVIPLTMANLKGHEDLYKEGWFIITSSDKALAYAKQHSLDSSAEAISKAKLSILTRTTDYQKGIATDISESFGRAQELSQKGKQNTQAILANTNEMSSHAWQNSQENGAKAWHSFINGYLYLSDATEGSLNALKNVPTDYQDNVKKDFSELFDGYKSLRDASATNIQEQWEGALVLGEEKFKQAYEVSGQKSNSLEGLGSLLWGYVESAYQGVFKPVASTSWQVTKYSAVVAGEAIFLPVASTYILTKNTLQSSGLAFYYTGETAIEVLAPTVKGGFHAGVSLLSAGAAPLAYVGGTSLGMINQTASTIAAPVVASIEGVAKATASTVQYAALVAYDGMAGTTKVFVNQFRSGVVLGYNALTVIPSHLLLGAANSAVFLIYDGPRLSVAVLKGQVKFKDKVLEPGALPVGSIVDLKALSSQGDAKFEIISSDPELIEEVLNQLPKDLKK